MTAALAGQPVLPFPPPVFGGTTAAATRRRRLRRPRRPRLRRRRVARHARPHPSEQPSRRPRPTAPTPTPARRAASRRPARRRRRQRPALARSGPGGGTGPRGQSARHERDWPIACLAAADGSNCGHDARPDVPRRSAEPRADRREPARPATASSPVLSSAGRSGATPAGPCCWTPLSALVLVDDPDVPGRATRRSFRAATSATGRTTTSTPGSATATSCRSTPTEKLNEGKVPYVDQPVEYPVLIGAAMEAGAEVAQGCAGERFRRAQRRLLRRHGDPADDRRPRHGDLHGADRGPAPDGRDAARGRAAAGLPCLHQLGSAGGRVHRRRPAGLVEDGRRRSPGCSSGSGAATKAYPLLMLVALGLLAYRAGRLRAWGRCAALGRGSALASPMPWCGRSPAATSVTTASATTTSGNSSNSTSTAPADWDSLAYVVQYLGRTFRRPRIESSVTIFVLLIVAARSALWRQTVRGHGDRRGVPLAIVASASRQTVSYARSRGAIPSVGAEHRRDRRCGASSSPPSSATSC